MLWVLLIFMAGAYMFATSTLILLVMAIFGAIKWFAVGVSALAMLICAGSYYIIGRNL